jgi:hypothetical protein
MLELLDVALKSRPGRLARLVLQHFNEDQGLFECLVHSAVRLRGRLAPLSPERVITASAPNHIK